MGRAREGGVLVPVALVLVLALTFFILQTYAATLDRLVEEQRGQAVVLARELAASLAPDAGETELERALRSAEPGGRSGPSPVGIALVDEEGIRVAAGDVSTGPARPAGGAGGAERGGDREVESTRAWGPAGGARGRIAAQAPLRSGEAAVRVELAAPALAADLARLRVVRWVVLGVGAGVVVLVILFLRSLFAPYEALLAQARRVGGPAGVEEGEDEVAFLLSTFEQALRLLQTAGARAGEGEASPETAAFASAGESGEDLTSLGRTLGATLTSGVLLLDRGGRVLAVNPLGASLLGLDPPPRSGTPLAEALAGQPRLAALLTTAVERGEALKRVEQPAGSRTLGLTLHPLHRDSVDRDGMDRERVDRAAADPPAGEARGFLLLFTDLTETRRREREKRLADGLAELGAMAAGAAHELRNSLGTLKGYLGLAERSLAEGGPEGGGREGAAREEELGEYLGEIRAESDRLERVLTDFLDFARPGTARAAEVRLDRLVRRAVADPALSALPGTPALRLEVEAPEPGSPADPWLLRADPLLLERAVKNLLSNAVEASREAPLEASAEVEVELVRLGSDYEVRISDSGPGLPPTVRERLFTPFVTGRPGGVGLGLALTHRIATLHGGSLTLEDRPEGGTRARLRLPASAVDETAAAEEALSTGG